LYREGDEPGGIQANRGYGRTEPARPPQEVCARVCIATFYVNSLHSLGRSIGDRGDLSMYDDRRIHDRT
jgi:hypothetical protein